MSCGENERGSRGTAPFVVKRGKKIYSCIYSCRTAFFSAAAAAAESGHHRGRVHRRHQLHRGPGAGFTQPELACSCGCAVDSARNARAVRRRVLTANCQSPYGRGLAWQTVGRKDTDCGPYGLRQSAVAVRTQIVGRKGSTAHRANSLRAVD